MARNRKRAKERRARRPAPSGSRSRVGEPGVEEATPDPIEHATPDVDLAEAQMAIGRPVPEDEYEPAEEIASQDELEAEAEAEERETEAESEEELASEGVYHDEVVPARVAVAERRAPRNRLIGFLQGSWRELQRVQWPDRRQVVQATGVVIGFVIVAGLYLAAADGLASKLMDYILK